MSVLGWAVVVVEADVGATSPVVFDEVLAVEPQAEATRTSAVAVTSRPRVGESRRRTSARCDAGVRGRPLRR